MNKTIWMYWENNKGSEKPAYLDLCLETIIKHSPDYKIIVLNEKTVYEYLPNLRRDLDKLEEIAQKADYIRAKIIYKYGGIWLDSDVILLKKINIEQYLEKYEYVGYGIEYGKPSIGFFGAVKYCSVLKEWIELMDMKLNEKLYQKNKPAFKQNKYKYIYKTIDIVNLFNLKKLRDLSSKMKLRYNMKVEKLNSIKWSEFGYSILWKLFEGYEYHNIEFNKFAPIVWNSWEKFFITDINLDSIVEKDTVAVMLYNKFMFEPLKNIDREELLNKNILLSKIFKLSLGLK
ncbi:MAG: capsular polysaccharide synthesis protein [Candidatus Krumholzibacteriota bacterium]|nr:capsular polysaccharide synthesis protein [Candidatus Krumholzibacteriota bacterium]